MEAIVNDISSVFSYDSLLSFIPEYVKTLADSFEYHPWIFAALGSMMVGLSGILPLLIIPIDETANLENGAGAATLRVLLSFAVGGLLGDVFLHLLPEAWQNDLNNRKEGEHVSMKCGLWVLCGMLVFIVVEKLFAGYEEQQQSEKSKQLVSPVEENGIIPEPLEIEDIHNLVEAEKKKRLKLNSLKDGTILPNCDGEDSKILYESCLFNNNANGAGMCGENLCNGALANGLSKGRCVMGNRWMGRCLLKEANLATNAKDKDKSSEGQSKHVAGYLNLMANSIDNFTHGLAVGGSFMVSLRVGLLTTFAILVHEIPHEVGDFAILLKSGFTRWEAAKAQLATASAGLIGAMAAVVFSGASNTIEAKTSWILPFTAGGFLHIAMVTVLPDLLKEEDKREALKQIVALISGIAIMATLTVYCG